MFEFFPPFSPGWKRNHQGPGRIQRQRRCRDSLQGYERTWLVRVHAATHSAEERVSVHESTEHSARNEIFNIRQV